jgi:hypothetical protein
MANVLLDADDHLETLHYFFMKLGILSIMRRCFGIGHLSKLQNFLILHGHYAQNTDSSLNATLLFYEIWHVNCKLSKMRPRVSEPLDLSYITIF